MGVFPFPYFPVQFTKEGRLYRPAEAETLLDGVRRGVSDLFMLSHGWNNNAAEAQALYAGLAAKLAAQIADIPALRNRTYAICGILWPSKRFEDHELIPEGAAALNDAITQEHLQARLRDLSELVQAEGWPGAVTDRAARSVLAAAVLLVSRWDAKPAARRELVDSLRGLLPAENADSEDASNRFFSLAPDLLVEQLARPLTAPRVQPAGGASLDLSCNGAAGFRDLFGGLHGALLHFLNFTTYYLMKARAGDVGVSGVKPLLESIAGVRLHLIGHSFGCRVLTAAVNTLSGADRCSTLTLLQGAFSHNGFASQFDGANDGAFRRVVAQKMVRGPILITHTRNDKAVGVAYPIASRLAGQCAAMVGDEHDLYGGLGSNGAQNTPERVVGTLLDVGGKYTFAGGKPHNLKADALIGGHSDIVKPQVAYAVAQAMAATA